MSRFICQLADIGSGWDAAGGGTVSSHKDRARVILKGANYATMFAYLWRRFGPPPTGWDPHKELVNYWLTTPVDGIAFGLACSPSFESCGAGVFYAISPKWAGRVHEWESGAVDRWFDGFANHCLCEFRTMLWAIDDFVRGPDMWGVRKNCSAAFQAQAKRLHREYVERVGRRPFRRHYDEWPGMEFGFDRSPVPLEQLEPGPHRDILTAIEAGLRDLLRPVNIRDTYVNACGRVEDVRRAVRPFKDAGYGCQTKKGGASHV